MDMIEFSEEQSMLLETAAGFCRDNSPIEKVRSTLDAETVDREQWQQMAELGWMGINVPEEHGGLGMGIGSVVPVVESMGRQLMGSPYSASVIVAECLVTAGSDDQKANWLPGLVAGAIGTLAVTEEDGSWKLDNPTATGSTEGDTIRLGGNKCFVTDADVSDIVIANVQIEGEARLVLIEADQIPRENLTREVVIDQTRRSFRLDLDGIAIGQDQVLPGQGLDTVELGSMLLLAAEMSGGQAGVLKLIVEYLNTRKAFNRYIGSYQSLKHPSADILIDLEAQRSHLYHAATMINRADAHDREVAVRMAKACGSEAYAYAGDRAVQFHGGFGFTFECDAQLYLRRALWCQFQFGDERYQRQVLAPLLLSEAS